MKTKTTIRYIITTRKVQIKILPSAAEDRECLELSNTADGNLNCEQQILENYL